MNRACIAVAALLIAACTPRNAAERSGADCQRRAVGPVAEAECLARKHP